MEIIVETPYLISFQKFPSNEICPFLKFSSFDTLQKNSPAFILIFHAKEIKDSFTIFINHKRIAIDFFSGDGKNIRLLKGDK